MALLALLVGARGRMATLGVVVFPIAAATLAGYAGYGHRLVEAMDTGVQLHAWCALLAYARSEEHTSELQSLMRISYAVFCLKKKNTQNTYENKSTVRTNA